MIELVQMLQMFCDRWAGLLLRWEVIHIPTVKKHDIFCKKKALKKSTETFSGKHIATFLLAIRC